MVTHLWR